jgi:hypothetical protein
MGTEKESKVAYVRPDGAAMVEVSPHVYVNRELIGLVRR